MLRNIYTKYALEYCTNYAVYQVYYPTPTKFKNAYLDLRSGIGDQAPPQSILYNVNIDYRINSNTNKLL